MYVPEELIRDPKMTDADITTWCLCSMEVYAPWKDSSLITISQIAYQLRKSLDVSNKIKDKIAKSIQHLLEEKYLIGNRQGKQFYELFKESFMMENYEYFVKIEEPEMRKIFQHTRSFAVLRTYLLILSTINPKTKCSAWNREQIAGLIDISPVTISNYIKFFESEKLLYIYHSKPRIGGGYFSNIYSRYEDREAAKAYGDSRSGSNGETSNTNLKRRYAQMYNMVKSGYKKYSTDEMQELRKYCEAENARRQKIYDKNPSYDQKFFDISVLV